MSDEAIDVLRAAKLWLDALVQASDIDPDETRLTVSAVSPSQRQELATVTLTKTLARIDAAIAAGDR